MASIFSSICEYISANDVAVGVSIGANIISNVAYDELKKRLDFSSLKNKINRFFTKEKDSDLFIEEICTKKAINLHKPDRDIEDCYETLTGNVYDKTLFKEIKNWIIDNKTAISNLSNIDKNNTKGINVGIQNAGNNIYNIHGNYILNKK